MPRVTTLECRVCGAEGKLMACSGCKSAFYCSEKCQRVDWRKVHRGACTRLYSAVPADAQCHICLEGDVPGGKLVALGCACTRHGQGYAHVPCMIDACRAAALQNHAADLPPPWTRCRICGLGYEGQMETALLKDWKLTLEASEALSSKISTDVADICVALSARDPDYPATLERAEALVNVTAKLRGDGDLSPACAEAMRLVALIKYRQQNLDGAVGGIAELFTKIKAGGAGALEDSGMRGTVARSLNLLMLVHCEQDNALEALTAAREMKALVEKLLEDDKQAVWVYPLLANYWLTDAIYGTDYSAALAGISALRDRCTTVFGPVHMLTGRISHNIHTLTVYRDREAMFKRLDYAVM